MKKINKKSNKKKYNIPSSGRNSKKNNKNNNNNKKNNNLKRIYKKVKENKIHKGGKRKKNNNNNNNNNNNEGNNYNNDNNNNNDDDNLSDIMGKGSKSIDNVDLFNINQSKNNKSPSGASGLDSTVKNLKNNIDLNNLSEEELEMLMDNNEDENNNNNIPPTYYNTLSFENKVKVDANQGLYLPGFDFTNFLDYTNYKFKQDNDDAKEEDIKTIDMFGEDVDVSYNNVVNKKMGYRDFRIDNTLKPEVALTELSSFNDIITEAKKYTSQKRKYVTMYGLYNMVVILSKYKKSEAQWLRVASLLEITHRYKGGNITRTDFFNSQLRLDMDTLNAMEEFWKTDHIFMTDEEIENFKNELEFYRHVEEEK